MILKVQKKKGVIMLVIVVDVVLDYFYGIVQKNLDLLFLIKVL